LSPVRTSDRRHRVRSFDFYIATTIALLNSTCSNNLNRADAVLNRANPQDLDLLVLPELAFSGQFVGTYYFSYQHLRLALLNEWHTSVWLRSLQTGSLIAAGWRQSLAAGPLSKHS
jgi:hypothetical protein